MVEMNNKIKVLHVINSFNLGGAEVNLLNLLKAFPRDCYDLHVGYSFGGDFEADFRQLDIKLFKYNSKKAKVKSFQSLINIFMIAQYLLRNRIKIVHTHNFSAHVWGSVAAKLTGAKVIEHVHDFRYEEPHYLLANGRDPQQFRLVRYFAKLSNRILVLTRNNHDFLIRHKMADEAKIRLQLNGIPLAQPEMVDETQLRGKLGIADGKKIILTAARMSKEKNILMVLQTARGLREKHGDVLFVIAGDGPEKEPIAQEIKNQGLEGNVKLIGFYPNVRELLAAATVFMQPTLMELHSITMLESLSMHTPTLVSKGVGCNDDFISHGVNGFLLDPHDHREWVAALDSLLNDPAKFESVAAAGRALVEEKGDINKTVQALDAVYEELSENYD
ncbi:MAG: glycosyltransferase [Candidatus Omnitrophica bacterium]|nr:glycosyltransferase [Candidatus Omnitrophota bacterium]